MEVVLRFVVFISRVTLQAHAVAGGPQCQAVWLVTITAGHPGVIHLALQKRAINVDFILYLAISEIHALIQEPRQVVIQ